jgi:protein-S-isoprenylcysteine O-methyltransferase Ste14
MIPLRLAGLALWGSVLLYLINPAWISWARLPLPNWIRWIGVGLAALSIPLMYWLFSSIGTNITHTVGTRERHQLVTHGIYRWVRHPLYSVGMTFFLSIALIAANWFIAAAEGFGFIFLLLRLPQEEQKLIERFGDEYRSYMEKTGRFFPRLNLKG